MLVSELLSHGLDPLARMRAVYCALGRDDARPDNHALSIRALTRQNRAEALSVPTLSWPVVCGARHRQISLIIFKGTSRYGLFTRRRWTIA